MRCSTLTLTESDASMQDPPPNQAPDSMQSFDAAIGLRSDLQLMKKDLETIDKLALRITTTLANGFGVASRSGKTFNETLGAIGQSLLRLAIRESTRTITSGLVKELSAVFTPQEAGAASVIPHANGGIIASPAYFSASKAVGLMGERGAEAIMPLARGADGRLGVVTQNDSARPVSVTVNIAATDLDSFRRSESQITSALARAVARGHRHL